jgi:hypothetical protein
MAVTGTQNTISYATNGVTTAFAYPYYLFQFSDMDVSYTPSSGSGSVLVLNSDYSLTGTADTFGAYPTGATLTTLGLGVLSSPLAPGNLLMTRSTQETQQIQYIDGDKFPAMKHEHALDKLTLEIQDISLHGFLGVVSGRPGSPGTADGQWMLQIPAIPGGNFGWVWCAVSGTWNAWGAISL